MISGYFGGQIDPNDLGFWRGWSVFEAMEARGKIIFHFEDHFARLARSCKLSGIPLPAHFSFETLKNQLAISLGVEMEKSKSRKFLVKVLITQGSSQDHKTPQSGQSNWHYRILPLPKHNAAPLKLVVFDAIKSNFPEVKSTGSYHDAMVLKSEAQKKGFDDFLYHFPGEEIKETSGANIFFVWNGEFGPILYTPGRKILFGITRKIVLDIAKKEKFFYKVEEYLPNCYQDLSEYSKNGECFITSTSFGVHSVSHIQERGIMHKFKTGSKTVTEKLRKSFQTYREEYFKMHGV